MSDIVERLREGEAESVDGWWFVMAEAANEIERLRAENEKLDDIRIDYICKINKLVDEREKLRKELSAERERCAKIADSAKSINKNLDVKPNLLLLDGWRYAADHIAAAIRESGE